MLGIIENIPENVVATSARGRVTGEGRYPGTITSYLPPYAYLHGPYFLSVPSIFFTLSRGRWPNIHFASVGR
jgi:hypothetical protein